MNKPDLDIIMPIYNESASIKEVITRLFAEITIKLRIRFVLCEDGSIDQTKEILRRLQQTIPMKLITSNTRHGYSRALLSGMKSVTAPYVLCIDSDGQYSPKDFWKLWKVRENGDVVVGYRKRRSDPWPRKIMSQVFYFCFRSLFPKNIHDPSCSFVLMRRSILQQIVPTLGLTNEGFWWEFMARARQYGFIVHECEVEHKPRQSGKTKVYSAKDLPRIAYTHIIAMIQIGLSRRVAR